MDTMKMQKGKMHTKGKQMGINTYKENTNGHKKDTQKFNTDKHKYECDVRGYTWMKNG